MSNMGLHHVAILIGVYIQICTVEPTDVNKTASAKTILFLDFNNGAVKPNISQDCKCGIDLLRSRSGISKILLMSLIKHQDMKVINGKVMAEDEHPYLALLLKMNPRKKKFNHICGGTIINDKYVLTAAHCFGGSKRELLGVQLADFLVRLGVHNKFAVDEGITYSITQLSFHRKYKTVEGGGLDHDIALVKLNATIHYSTKIRPTCLPTMDTSGYSLGRVQGWGKTEKAPGSSKPRQAKLVVLSDQDCRESSIAPTMGEPDTKICAEDSSSDACQGDSGGPLFITTNSSKTVQIGIISSGKSCGDFFYPGVYTKLEKYMSWIYQYTPDATYCSL